MKMTKSKNIVLSIVFVVLLVIGTIAITVFGKNIVKDSYALGATITSANVSNGSDIVAIRVNSSSGVAGVYVGTTSNLGTAVYYPANGKSTINVSLLNGTYHLWVKDSSGQISKYGRTVTVNNSCSSDYRYNVTGSGSIKHCYFTADGSYLEETKSEELIHCANGYVRDQSQTRVTQDTCSGLNAQSIRNMGLSKKMCTKTWTYACVPAGGGGSSGSGSTLSVQSATTSNDWTQGNKEIKVTAQKGSSDIAGYYISTSSQKPSASGSWNASSSTSWSTSQPAGTYYIWVKDTAGNVSNNYKSVTVSKIDNTVPVIDSVIPSSVDKTITINASDSESGVGSYYISESDATPNGSSNWVKEKTIPKQAGTYYVWARDNVGNISKSKKVVMSTSSKTDNNSLSALSISGVELTPAFDTNVLEYSATATTSKIKIDATLADTNASFTKNYGPRSVNLKSGKNNVLVKVKSALGNEKTYKIEVTYNGKEGSKTSARLKSLKLNSGNLTFDPDITDYRMYVPVSLEKLEVTATAEDPNAKVEVENPETLQVGDNSVKITVSATDGTTKVYSLRIIKKDTEEISTNNYLKSLSITGFEINFKRDIQTYAIGLGKKKNLNVNAVAEDTNAEVTIDNTMGLTKEDVVKVMVRAEDGSARIYSINLNKGTWTVAKIILIILGSLVGLVILAVIILKIMGYSIYINFGIIKDFFAKLFKRNEE